MKREKLAICCSMLHLFCHHGFVMLSVVPS